LHSFDFLTKVHLDLTSRCLFHCKHCRLGAADPQREMTFEEIGQIIDDLARMQVSYLAFGGGEPFLRSDIVELLEYAYAAFPGRVLASTTGVTLPRHILATLSPMQDRFSFRISLHGPPQIHDAIRGRSGAFAAAYETIGTCVQMGFDVQVRTILMRDNAASIQETLEWVQRSGCSRHDLAEVIPVNRATQQMALTQEDRLPLQRTIALTRKHLEREGYRIVARIPFAPSPPEEPMCGAGISECSILSDGRVVGCRLMPQRVEGNVRERPLFEIWADPDGFRSFRQQTTRSCQV
jgi:MoaA/NifB/PqqE/SkfB family radical SAM enzyme